MHERFNASAGFQRKIERIDTVESLFWFNHASAFYTNNKIVKNVDE